jgi:hypothetical protein
MNMKYEELLLKNAHQTVPMKITIAAGWSGLVTDGFRIGTN